MRNKKLWIFNAGMAFSGNPKWLFLYIVNYRKDITPIWFCYDTKTKNIVKKLGYKACLFDSKEGEKIGAKAGVYVVDQYKEVLQDYLNGITILNLWHGVGGKSVELKVESGFLDARIVKKHIINKLAYKKYMLFLATSPMMETHFREQCDIDEDKIIRAGYPCNEYPEIISTYNHDLLKAKGLPSDTKIAVYAPTYRDSNKNNFFSTAVPDMDKLIKVLEQENFLLIFKMHPQMLDDFEYKNIKEKYKSCKNVLFWDNSHDFYECMYKIDFAIIDYSSIFYDMLAHGIKNFARYIFDYSDRNNTLRNLSFDYLDNTCGQVCKNFNELLDAFSNYETTEKTELDKIYDRFWSYAKDADTFSIIIDRALNFKPVENYSLPTLYSFDIFDTLIGRATLRPDGIFRYVQDKMNTSSLYFPTYLKSNFCKIREQSEANCREYFRKSQEARNTDKIEVTFDMIYEHMRKVLSLSNEQVSQLKNWELEGEYESSIPCTENIKKVKSLIAAGNDVILISDMYLPKNFIRKLLEKADPMLMGLPLFLSCEYGVQKTTKKLFLKAYHEINYKYEKWIHYGDNPKADGYVPRSLGIETVNHPVLIPNDYELELTRSINSYDSYLVSALFTDFRSKNHTQLETYAYCYASLYWIPYVYWALQHAMQHGIECVYFISRDGHFLKQIADVLIKENNWKIKSKYIYGSRKAWRIPSQIHEIDQDFFSDHGNFVGITGFSQLIEAGDISESNFLSIFPELGYLKDQKSISKRQLNMVRQALSKSEKYRRYILQKASEEREIVLKYLKQEIDFNEKYAFIEYWGRGYTQTCLAHLLDEASGKKENTIFYYARSIYPSIGSDIRYNFTCNNYSLIFVESLFANLPYKSIQGYRKKNGIILPDFQDNPTLNRELFDAFSEYLPRFAHDYSHLKMIDRDMMNRCLFDFALSYFYQHMDDKNVSETLAMLKDNPSTYGKVEEYAPKITVKRIIKHFLGEPFPTKNKELSIQRSNLFYQIMYYKLYKPFERTELGHKFRQKLGEKHKL